MLVHEVDKVVFRGELILAVVLSFSKGDEFLAHEVIQINIDVSSHAFVLHVLPINELSMLLFLVKKLPVLLHSLIKLE
jgi:hypothetical protein